MNDAPRNDGPSVASALPAHVLYIEDNATNAEVMRGFLRLRPHVTLEVCTTVAAGLAALRERLPALLLLDMNLPDGTGMDVLRVVRVDPHLAAMPVVIVSADAMSAQVDAALAAGADSYLPKPLRMAEVLSHIDDALRLGRLRAGDVSGLEGMTPDEAPSLGTHGSPPRGTH